MVETLNGKSGYIDWRPNSALNGGLHPFWKEKQPPFIIFDGTVAVRPTEIPQFPSIDTTNFINRALAHRQQQDDRRRDLVPVCCSNGACPNHGREYRAKLYGAPSLDQQYQEQFVGPCVTCEEWTLIRK